MLDKKIILTFCVSISLIAEQQQNPFNLPKPVQDFAVGFTIGAVQGGVNQVMDEYIYMTEDQDTYANEKILQMTTLLLSHNAMLRYEKKNHLHSTTMVGACVGQIVVESFIASYASVDGKWDTSIVLNLNTLVALGSNLYDLYSKNEKKNS